MTIGDLAHECGISKTVAKRIAYREYRYLRAPGGKSADLTPAERGHLRRLFLAERPVRPPMLPGPVPEEASMSDLSAIAGPMAKAMTVRQVAEALNVSDDSVLRSAKALFPGLIQNGKPTMLDEAQVTAIKQRLEGHHNLRSTAEVREATTDLEVVEMTVKVLGYWKAKADELAAKVAEQGQALAIAAPKIEGFDALMRSERCMSITDAAKHFGLHPKTEVFPYLRARGYLTQNNLPTQDAIDAGYLSLKETKDQLGNIWPQAVVEAWQLERWRAHVVHQVKRWAGEVAS